MISLALYPIYASDVAPHYTIQKAFESNFDCITYDWVKRSGKIGLRNTQLEFIEILKDKRPEYALLQLQNPINMSVEMVREMARHTKVINWSGDVRDGKDWYKWFEDIGREIHLTLFSNMTDVEIMRDRGVRADYLQVGYDNGWYYPGESKSGAEIVFSAHYHSQFPLSKYRVEVAKALTHEFKDRFQLYGNGWEKVGLKSKFISCQQEAEAYRSAKIGISASNFPYKRYHSDRLLRIMGSGCLPVSHWYEGIELDYTDVENIVIFHNVPELIDLCHHYLKAEHGHFRYRISQNAYYKAIKQCTWDYRCKELIQLIEKWG